MIFQSGTTEHEPSIQTHGLIGIFLIQAEILPDRSGVRFPLVMSNLGHVKRVIS